MVKSCPNWHKTAFKFHRIRCTICLTSPDNQKKKTTPESRVPAWFLCHGMMHCDCKSCCETRGVSECSAQLHTRRTAFHRSSQGTAGTAGLLKRLTNRKANCFSLLKRITILKCVNSEFKSVDIDPDWGCLNWPYGTMSESP